MEERKFIKLKKEEFGIKEYIKRDLGKGKISRLNIEYTPVGEKIVISTNKPGLVIGKRGEKIQELTEVLKKRFKLENPHIEIQEIENPLFDAQSVADEMAMALERMGNLKFKVIAYRKLREIMNAGALGCEMRFTGKLPSERAKSWRFAEGYLKKAGESRKEIDRAQATALTKTGIIGLKVAIMTPNARIYDRIDIDEKMKARIKGFGDDERKIDEKTKKEKMNEKRNFINDKESESKSKSDNSLTNLKKNSDKEVKKGSFSEEKMETENEDIKPEADGTAVKIEQENEEGVPQEVIDKELKGESLEEVPEKIIDDKLKVLEENYEKNVKGKIDKGEEISKGEKK